MNSLFERAALLNRFGAQQLINGSVVINGFDAALNSIDFLCRGLHEPEVGQQSQTREPMVTSAGACWDLPKISEQFLASMKALNLVFYLPVAARRYSQNFRLLTQIDSKIFGSFNPKASGSDWTRAMEEQGVKAESAYLALSKLNPGVYRRDCVSFLREEAAYYETLGAIEKSAAISGKIHDMDPENSIQMSAPHDSSKWIKYVN